jgi:nucleoid-associated protein YgaU
MTRLARRLLAMVSIAGGGLLAAAPTASATAPDPTPSTTPPPSQAAATPAATPVLPLPPPVTLPLRTGLAVPAQPDAPAADDPPDLSAAATLRTGRAPDLIAPLVPAPAPAAAAPTPQPPAVPAPPTPAPRRRDASSPAAPVGGDEAAPAPLVTPPAAAPPPVPSSYTVVAGDSLWSIAAAQVAQRLGQTPVSVAAAAVTPYWQAVCNANRSSLRSGDLNVIFPGEQISLPPL